MAVQKSRVSPSKRGMRRAHDSLSSKQLATDPTTGETHIRHHITADGYYRGKKVIDTQSKVRLWHRVAFLNDASGCGSLHRQHAGAVPRHSPRELQ